MQHVLRTAPVRRSHANTLAFTRMLLKQDIVHQIAQREKAIIFAARGQKILNAKALCPLTEQERLELKNKIDRDRLFRDYPGAGNFAICDRHDKYHISAGSTDGRCIRVFTRDGRKLYFCFDFLTH